MNRLNPAAKVVDEFGGVKAVVDVTRVHRTRVYLWMRPKEDGGTGGTIPQRHIPTLMAEATKRGLNLTANDFLGIDPAPTQREPAQ